MKQNGSTMECIWRYNLLQWNGWRKLSPTELVGICENSCYFVIFWHVLAWGRHIGRARGVDHEASNLAAPAQSRSMRRASLRAASNHLPVCFPTCILSTLTISIIKWYKRLYWNVITDVCSMQYICKGSLHSLLWADFGARMKQLASLCWVAWPSPFPLCWPQSRNDETTKWQNWQNWVCLSESQWVSVYHVLWFWRVDSSH